MSGVAEVSPEYLTEAASNAVPVGYKQTEVGVIPTDWDAVCLGDVSEVRMCKRILAGQTQKIGAIPFFKIGTFGGEPDAYIPQFLYEDFKAKYSFPDKGDILISAAGTLGKSVIYDGMPAYFQDSNIVWLKVNQRKLLNEYLYHYYKVIKWASSEGSTIARLYNGIIRASMIALPATLEQTAIANALSDVDALISELEKLIAKKQAIKTATMQQLLTGRTRLPQFALREDGTPKRTKPSELGEIPEDWEVKTYGEVFTFLSTSTNSRADLSEDGDFGYVHYGDIHTEWNNKLDLNKERLPRISKNIVSSAFVMDGDLIMADASEDYEGIGKTVEVFNVGDKQLVAGLHTFLLRDKEKVLADGFRGYLHSIPAVKSSFDRLATGMKVYGISKNNLSSVCIPVPSLEEQTAIATILSDMDEEIQALEQRLGKTRQIKQGMMQELLTGKTRLMQPLNKESQHG